MRVNGIGEAMHAMHEMARSLPHPFSGSAFNTAHRANKQRQNSKFVMKNECTKNIRDAATLNLGLVVDLG